MPSARAHINPKMLIWARQRVNADPAVVAKRAGTSLAIYQEWEAGERRPTIKQLQKVAKYLKRPVGQFYLNEPPEEPEPRIEMRRVFGGDPVTDSTAFALEVQACMRYRETARLLYERLGRTPPDVPRTYTVNHDPEQIAATVRFEWFALDVSTQVQWPEAYAALRGWREALEDLGVLSFQISRVPMQEARGFAIADRPLPVAAFNSKDSVRGRIFTLIHEFAHILLGTSTLHAQFPLNGHDDIEDWCNRFAAALLIPRNDLLQQPVVKQHGEEATWTECEIEMLATRYVVSPAALIRRLQTFERIAEGAYAALREEFDGRRRSDRIDTHQGSTSGGNFYNNQLTRLGSLLPRLAFQGFYANAISAGDLSSIMGTKVNNLGTFEQKVMGQHYAFSER